MKPYYKDDSCTIYHGRCEDILPTIAESSISLVATDPPYFKVKADWWDHQWDKPEAFLAWMGGLCDQWQRVLNPNGSLYVFASPQMVWGVEGEVRKRFNVLNRVTWRKPSPSQEDNFGAGRAELASKETFRQFFPAGEYIVFAEQFGSDNMAKGEAGYVTKCDEIREFVFEPLRAYLADEWKRAGLTVDDANTACSTATMAGHFFNRAQWALPTADKYEKLQTYANRDGGEYLRREYEDLRREYEDLRREYEELRREYEDLRRPFHASENRPYTDVWDFKTVSDHPGKHPCQKPLAMMEHIVQTSTRDGDIVLDCFGGSFRIAEACRSYGRKFIGVEADERYCEIAAERLRQGVLF